jgi:anti-sigma factor RsiW
MRCPIQTAENAEVLLAYCARKLDPETQALLERHMAQCPECRAFGEQQRALWEALDAWEAMPVSADFDRRLLRRLENVRAGGRRKGLRSWIPSPVPLAAASVLLAAVLLLRAPRPASLPEADSVELAEVERAERALEDIEMLRTLDLMARVEAPGAHRM